MNFSNFQVRRAVAGDAHRIAYLSYLAGRGQVKTSAYDLIIPGPHGPTSERLDEMSRLLRTSTRSWFHYSRYTVADIDGLVVAALCAFARKERHFRPLVAAFQEIGWTDEDIAAMRRDTRPFIAAELGVPLDSWVIENVGCYEEDRRRGLTYTLLETVIEEGREQGFQDARIGVFVGNGPAIRAYEKAGFVITGEKRDPDFERVFECPGMYQMTLEL